MPLLLKGGPQSAFFNHSRFMPPSKASTASEVDGVIWACYHGNIQRFGMMAVDVGVFIIMRWVHRDVSLINTSCDTGKACYGSEFSGEPGEPIAKRTVSDGMFWDSLSQTGLSHLTFSQYKLKCQSAVKDIKKLLSQDLLGVKPTKLCSCSENVLCESKFKMSLGTTLVGRCTEKKEDLLNELQHCPEKDVVC